MAGAQWVYTPIHNTTVLWRFWVYNPYINEVYEENGWRIKYVKQPFPNENSVEWRTVDLINHIDIVLLEDCYDGFLGRCI